MQPGTTTTYRERLTVPVAWWLMLIGLAGAAWLIYHHAYGFRVSVPAGAVVLALGTAVLLAYGALTIRVDHGTLRVGRASVPLSDVGQVDALAGDAARAARGRDLDPRAYTAIRGYADAVVRVRIIDPADPTPYWLMSTRRPERLMAELEAARRRRDSGE